MHIAPSHHTRARRITGLATAAVVAAGVMSLTPSAQGQDQPVPAGAQEADTHRANGRVIGQAAGSHAESVKAFFRGNGRGVAAGTLRVEGQAWRSRGVSHVRMKQYVDGLRVHDTYARAAFNDSGQLVDLVENIAPVPADGLDAATVGADDALRAAVGKLFPNRSVDTRVAARSGNTTSYARAGFYTNPTVEKVAVPTKDGGMAVGYVVQTWTLEDNQLHETLVAGDGTVVETLLRTAQDSYNIFEEDPESSRQTIVSNPAGAESPKGWLFPGGHFSTNISGNNAHAYLDTNNDNAPDAGGVAVADGRFVSTFDANISASNDGNKAVAVQNLFYLNNLIHDTLYRAGFDEVAGNFQENNFGLGGRGSDPVAAEAQDGGGTDNANFATPPDGQDPRMQMYLWSVPGMFEVKVADGPAAGSYDAANAEWGPAITAQGVTGPLAIAVDDGSPAPDGTPSPNTGDACSTITNDLTGKVAIVDRGICAFTEKARNVQAAGAKAVVVVNNVAGQPVPMGGSDRRVTIPGLMVSQDDGRTLKTGEGSNATLRLNPNAIMRDGDLDSDIVWHEYGHGLTWRMIGRMDGPLAGAIGEGMSDVLAMIANGDPTIGEYSASDPVGIRSEPYDGYSRTYGDIVGEGVHFDGEVYAAIGWDLLQRYGNARIDKSVLLADLVDGMNYTPAQPTYEQMRDGILAGLDASGNSNRTCMVWESFAKFGVGVGAKGTVRGAQAVVKESFTLPSTCGGNNGGKGRAAKP